jgi:hypothetical protein
MGSQDYVDGKGLYTTVPLTLAVDLASLVRSDGLQYRVGLHHVAAREVHSPSGHGAAAGSDAALRTSLHVQGAVAVEGEAMLWKPPLPRARSFFAAAESPAMPEQVGGRRRVAMEQPAC